MKYLIERESRVEFSGAVREHHIQLRIAPWDYDLQTVHSFSLAVEPEIEWASHRDGYGNQVHRFGVMSPHQSVSTRMQVEVETLLVNPFNFEPIAPERERAWIADSLNQAPRLWDFVYHRSPATPELSRELLGVPVPALREGEAIVDQVQALMEWIRLYCDYEPTLADACADLGRALRGRCAGSADLAHLMLSILRSWGLPARFATGYIDPRYFEPDDEDEDAEPLEQSMHNWVELLLPGAGWRGFDPARELLADETYVRVAVGREAGDVLTERQAYKGGAERSAADVRVAVTPAS